MRHKMTQDSHRVEVLTTQVMREQLDALEAVDNLVGWSEIQWNEVFIESLEEQIKRHTKWLNKKETELYEQAMSNANL